jgi:hypothetical protein
MAEKKVIELEVKTESLKPLKAQLREAQAEVAALAEKFGATSKEAVQAAKKAAELKDAIADAKNLTDAYNPDAKFNALSASISGVLNGFQAFEGALGLVGVEGEAVQATLLKVQSAMALTQGINGILEAKEDFANLGKQITGVYEGAVKGFQNMTAAGKVFAITGIGLLITGLSLVITYWDDIRKAVGDVSEEEQKLAEYRRQYAAEQDKQVAEESKGFATLIAQLKASNKGSKERSELISEINKKYGTTLKNLSDEAEFQNQLNQELANYLTYQQAKFRLQKNEEAIVRNLETQSKLKRDIVQAEKDIVTFKKQQKEAEKELKNASEETVQVQERGLGQISQGQKKSALEQSIENAKNQQKELQGAIDKNKQSLLQAEDRFENYGKAAIYASGQIDKLTYSGKKYVEQNTEVKTSTEKVTKTVVESKQNEFELTEEIENNLRQMLVDQDDKKLEDKKNADAIMQEQELANMQFKGDLYKQDVDNYDKSEAEKKKLREDNLKSSINAVQQGFSLIAEFVSQNYSQYQKISQAILSNDKLTAKEKQKQLEQNNKLAKHSFDVQKKVAIAGALIDTYKGAASAYASTPGGPIIKAASAALAVAAGLLNVRNIQKQEFEATTMPSESEGGGGSGTGSGVVASNVITPNFNIVGNAQATNPLAGLGGQPLQAYVVSGDVTTAQSLDRNRINYATFG